MMDSARRLNDDAGVLHSYEDAKSQKDSNYWSSTENNSNNAWNVNFNNGNINNNNKNNGYVVRPVAAYDGLQYFFGHLPAEAVQDKKFLRFFLSIHEAYKDCLRGKKSSPQALEYMQVAWADLPSLAWEMWTGTYSPTTSTCFLVRYPKLREVFAACFRDRIIHHWICLRLEPLFEDRFIRQGNVSFNCRKGYGTEKAVMHVAEGMRRVSRNYRKPAWVFKGDLVGFFMSIDKELLWFRLERFITRWKKRYERQGWAGLHVGVYANMRTDGMPEMYWDILLRTTRIVVMHHPEDDCIINSPVGWWANLAPNKSLFTSVTGEPIGNLTTQLFANFFMSFFVVYVLWMYRGKDYCFAQFVDDFVLVSDDLRFLIDSISKIGRFLSDKMHLTLHEDKRYLQPVSHGVAFVGSYIKPGRVYLSNRTLARFEERVAGFIRLLEDKEELSIIDCKRMEQVLNSYLGFCKDRKTYGRRKEILRKMPSKFYKYFCIRGHYESIRAKPKYREVALLNDLVA